MSSRRLPQHLFFTSALLAVAWTAVSSPGLGAQVAVLVPVVALLGVPHGALDVDMARALWPLERREHRLLFGVGYLAVAGGILALWLTAPAVALAAFLLYSAAHFAGDWRAELAWPVRLAAGAAVVALPAWRFEPEVAAVFAVLAPLEAARLFIGWLHDLAPVVAGSALGGALVQRRWGAAGELCGLTALALTAPPLVYFVVYFCGLHSPRHFVETLDRLALDAWRGARAALPLTALTLGCAAVAALWLQAGGTAPDRLGLKVVFIGLAALAVPHMVLVERFWTRA